MSFSLIYVIFTLAILTECSKKSWKTYWSVMQQLDATSYLALPPDVPGFTVTSLDHCHALYMDDGSYVRVAVIDHYPYWIQCANCDVPDQCACRWAEYPQTSLHYTKTNEMSEQEMINKKLVDYYYSFSSNYPHYQLNNDIVTEVHTNIESSANEENVKHIHIPLDGLLNSAANIKETLDTEVKSKGADDSETDGIKEIIHTVHKDTGTAKIKEVYRDDGKVTEQLSHEKKEKKKEKKAYGIGKKDKKKEKKKGKKEKKKKEDKEEKKDTKIEMTMGKDGLKFDKDALMKTLGKYMTKEPDWDKFMGPNAEQHFKKSGK